MLDQAEQKGTGRWTVQSALDLGVPVTGIAEAAFARSLSGHADAARAAATRGCSGTGRAGARRTPTGTVRRGRPQALYASKIVAYAQGFDQIRAGSDEYDWDIDPGAMATIWRGGCIIRARFLDRIREAYDDEPGPADAAGRAVLRRRGHDGVRTPGAGSSPTAAAAGHPDPGFSSVAGLLRRPARASGCRPR